MLEVYGDLWTLPADARVITTNGSIGKDGAAVMGRGVAKQAADRYPNLPYCLAGRIRMFGNHVFKFSLPGEKDLLTFPVKDHWDEPARFPLIERSARELAAAARALGYRSVVLPRPGCGNGRLAWVDVKPVIEPLLDDKFFVVTNEEP